MIDKYQNLIFSICYRMTQNYFDAEDLAQDTFLSAYKNLDTFDRNYEKAWLTRIATNKCLDYLKRASSKTLPTEDEVFNQIEDKSPSPEEAVLALEVRDRLYQACSHLKPPYDQVAIDYFYYEMDVGQMAARTGKNVKTLQTQVYRAKAQLRKELGKEQPL